MAITCLAFDLDGTLYPDSSLRVHLASFTLRNASFLVAFGLARAEIHARAAAGSGSADDGGCADEAWPRDLAGYRELQAALAARRWGRSAEEAFGRAEESVYGELEGYFAQVRLFDGVEDCLAELAAREFRLGLLSDFPPRRKLAFLGIADRFQAIRCSEESGTLKPARKPFFDLAADLGVAPEEILYVGNSLRYDVAGAKAAGMRAALKVPRIGRRPGRRPAGGHAGPDIIFSDYADLPDLVASLV